MELLKNKVALITGAAQGIGFSIALAFAEECAEVMMADIQAEKVKQAAQQISAQTGRRAAGHALDVTNKQEVEVAVRATIETFGSLDILVNNAGILRPNYIIEHPEKDFDEVLAVNVKGTFLCSQAAAKAMIEQGRGGSIIIISSASGKKPDPKGAAYCSSKSAQIGLMRVLALELGPYGIRAYAILPGATDTEMLRDVCDQVPGLKQTLEERTPLGKMASPRDQANAAVFLASDLATHVTGAQLVVSGGEFMAG
jgi:NAD(P)-dependent dehydrogenase (short-subunit alcohol dehydrogenase family)